jgi:isopentenyl phosphate kinase
MADRKDRLVFVKLGGSVITDKHQPETERPEVIARLAHEVARALARRPDLQLVLGHGSGSFGHSVARHYGTRQGVRGRAQWQGFAKVAGVAALLNRIVTEHFLEAGVAVWSLQPSASAWCKAGDLVHLATTPIEQALARGLVPMVYGDVALDEVQGGTIISTEQIFAYLARRFLPDRLVFVGAVDGVFDGDPLRDPSVKPIPEITEANWQEVRTALRGSHATDVTGGMQTKIEEVVNLVRELPGLTAYLISGERQGALESILLDPATSRGGTVIRWQGGAAPGT